MAINRKLQPIDRISILLIIVLSLLITGFMLGDNICGRDCWFQAQANVKAFSWENQTISSDDRALILTFSRPMNRDSVETNFQIQPELPGKFSWSGKRMAYTLDQPAPYGTQYQLTINGAKDRLGNDMNSFQETFRTRDRAFVYLGVQGQEQGRLILYNFTQQNQEILTPPNLVVHEFVSYPERDRILFSATSKKTWEQGELDKNLYTVTTGINSQETRPGTIELILDSETYQLLEFELSPDGKKIVVRRAKQNQRAETSLWLIEPDQPPQRLERIQGGEFMIPPDSQSLAIAQGQGVALIPLENDSDPSNFLPEYGQVLTFSSDGSAAAMVNFNTQDPDKQYKRSLFLVTNQGVEKNLLETEGSILSCEFSPTVTHLYCLLTDLVKGKPYQETPYLVSIDLETTETTPLLTLPESRDMAMSLSADGLGLLFDQIMTVSNRPDAAPTLRSDAGETIIGSRLWLLIPTPTVTETPSSQPELKELPISGLKPLWLP